MRNAPLTRLDDLIPVGQDLNRPECVLCTSDGNLFVSDWGGGVTVVRPDGQQRRFLAKDPPIELRPNGIALNRDGRFLVANLGDDGGIWSLGTDGSLRPVLQEVDGLPLPPSNFVLIDTEGRIWVTVSTTITPRAKAYRPDTNDGYIVLIDDSGSRIVADGLGYTNEVQIHPDGKWLYVNETFARRTSRMPIRVDGSLGPRETVTEYGAGTFPDGLCFDVEGGFWVVSVVSNRVLRVTPGGKQELFVEDNDPEHLQEVEAAFQNGQMGRPHLDTIRSRRLGNISSIAFGGHDKRSAYVGCLLYDRLMKFRTPIAGIEPAHWHWRVA